MTTSPAEFRPWIAVQYNPHSGGADQRHELRSLVSGLFRRGLRPRVFKDRGKLARWLADPALRTSLRCLVAAGGDGTIRDVVNRFPGVRLAILPLGTENLLAKWLAIPRDGAAVAELIAAGRTRRFDLGRVGDRRFLVMASVGFDAEVVRLTHSRRRGHVQKHHYIQPILETLRSYTYPRLTVADERGVLRQGRLAVVVNFPAYALGLQVAKEAVPDDGYLDVRLFAEGSLTQMLRYFYHLIQGTHESLTDVICLKGKAFRIESESPVPVQADGDPAGTTPIEVAVEPGACEVLVP